MLVFGIEIPFVAHLGIEPLGIVDGRTRLRLVLGPEHLNNHGVAHGGLVSTLLDTAMGTVARVTTGRPVVTLDMQVAFLEPGRGTLIAEGQVTRPGRSVVFCEAEVRSEAGLLVARATGLMKTVREDPQSTSAA